MFETGPQYVAQAGLELIVISLIQPPSAKITGVYHHNWVSGCTFEDLGHMVHK